ncbi:MAG: hypothetical protein JRG73_05300, partial [Deltaproteobacteria bacterium]|nr:hypothetical protein [Deltaproteobacteria bacterium]
RTVGDPHPEARHQFVVGNRVEPELRLLLGLLARFPSQSREFLRHSHSLSQSHGGGLARRLHMPVAPPTAPGFTTPGRMATLTGLTRPKRVLLRYGSHSRRIEAPPDRVTPSRARWATCQTGNLHGELLSVRKIDQAWPGATGITG